MRFLVALVCAIGIVAGAAQPARGHSYWPTHAFWHGHHFFHTHHKASKVAIVGNTSGGRGSLGFGPFGAYIFGSVFTAATAPIVGTIVLGREMTAREVWHTTLSAFLGPVGWFLADEIYPAGPSDGQMFLPGQNIQTGRLLEPGQVGDASEVTGSNERVSLQRQTSTAPGNTNGTPGRPRTAEQRDRGDEIRVPSQDDNNFVPEEILLEYVAGAAPQQIAQLENEFRLEQLEVRSFDLSGRTIWRYRIIDQRSVRAVLLALRNVPIVNAAQPNYYFLGQQAPSPVPQVEETQYVVRKMNLVRAHRVSDGEDVLVAVIDSQIDRRHPDLAGTLADEYDVIGGPDTPHPHGTSIAGAIAAHSKLVGVAPKARVLAIRAFDGEQRSARGTTFNILKGIDWAANRNARVVNMSFAGPFDPMLHVMLASAYRRGIVLIAAVGNAGPRSGPLYPAADRYVIGVTATDVDDKLLPTANRGSQVTVAAPGVQILSAAPNGAYQITSGTSIAAAHASGVAALLLARNASLTPATVRSILVRSARNITGRQREIGAGLIDASAAVSRSMRLR